MNKCIGLCKDCEYWTPNGGKTSWGAIYNDAHLDSLLGNCSHPIEPPYSRLKNELNTCDNFTNKRVDN